MHRWPWPRDLARDIFEGDSAFIVSPQSTPDALKLDVTDATLVSSAAFGEGVLELRAPFQRPRGELGRSQVRLGAFEFDVFELDAGTSDNAEIQSYLNDGDAVAIIRPNSNEDSRRPQEIAIYVPTDVVGRSPASFSGKAPMDVLQLTLAEDVRQGAMFSSPGPSSSRRHWARPK